MPKSSTSFKPGRSGNPSGRPKGVRSLARLIDSIGDETFSGTEDDFRTATIKRLWQAAATGKLNLGKTSRQLKNGEWLDLVQWLVTHMDKVAVEQWDWQGQSQIHAEEDMEAAEEEECIDGERPKWIWAQRITGDYAEAVKGILEAVDRVEDGVPQ
jgi:hypothetical protein